VESGEPQAPQRGQVLVRVTALFLVPGAWAAGTTTPSNNTSQAITHAQRSSRQARSRAPGRSVALTMAVFLFLAIQLAVLLPPVLHFLAVLVYLQPMFQLLGAALLLGSRVTFFLLLMQRLKLTLEGVITGPWRVVVVGHAAPPVFNLRYLVPGLHAVHQNGIGRCKDHPNHVMWAHPDGSESLHCREPATATKGSCNG
jgi:hypothetical protein